jgi:hypothetical protein
MYTVLNTLYNITGGSVCSVFLRLRVVSAGATVLHGEAQIAESVFVYALRRHSCQAFVQVCHYGRLQA